MGSNTICSMDLNQYGQADDYRDALDACRRANAERQKRQQDLEL